MNVDTLYSFTTLLLAASNQNREAQGRGVLQQR
jgi:hypothetical protein